LGWHLKPTGGDLYIHFSYGANRVRTGGDGHVQTLTALIASPPTFSNQAQPKGSAREK
jgi:hypothetical protein